jgi:NNP family nitrate/nitrite transporter-like MFS transporter
MTESRARMLVLWLSFIAFVLSFAAWLMFGILGVKIQQEFGLTDQQIGLLGTVALLNGAIWRLPLGMLADLWGGKLTMFLLVVVAAIASFLVPFAHDYPTILAVAFLVGIAGNSFTIGTAWNAAWFPKDQQGFAMGFFGMGNVGAVVTKMIGPALIAIVPAAGLLGGFVPGGWRFIPFLYGANRRRGVRSSRCSRRFATSASGDSASTTSSRSARTSRWRRPCRSISSTSTICRCTRPAS